MSYLRGLCRCRIRYRLVDLVEWIEFACDDRQPRANERKVALDLHLAGLSNLIELKH